MKYGELTLAFSFIHISDIHLGRPFSDLSKYSFDEKAKNIYKNAVEKAFNKFIDFTLEKNVDFVLIAGDTFDSSEQDFKSKLILKEGLKKLNKAGIKVFIACGNHDPIYSYNKNTFDFDEKSNIKIIGVNTNKHEKFTINDKNEIPCCIVHSYSFEENHLSESPLKYFVKPNEDERKLFNIGLLHCDLNSDKTSPYAPCTSGGLLNFNYDYWALGHIHIPMNIENISYSGTVQGRNTKETGAHGIKYLRVENNSLIENTFVPMDIVRFENIEINLSQALDTTTALETIQDTISEFINNNNSDNCELFLIKLNLTGHINFFSEVNSEFFDILSEKIKSDFYEKVYISEFQNETRPKIQEENLMSDDGISGEIYKTLTDENITNVMNLIDNEKEFNNLISNCCFNEEEYKQIRKEIKNIVKEECINLCNNIYYNEMKEENNA